MVRQSKGVALLGAFTSLGLYVIFGGIAAAVQFGERAGHTLADGLFGNPLPDTFAAHALVGFGLGLVIFASAAVFAVGGAFIASMASLLLRSNGKANAPESH